MQRRDPVSTLKGIGEQREKRLHRLNIFTVEQLLTHYPRDYKDRSQIMKINELIPNETATFLGQVRGEGQNGGRGRMAEGLRRNRLCNGAVVQPALHEILPENRRKVSFYRKGAAKRPTA